MGESLNEQKETSEEASESEQSSQERTPISIEEFEHGLGKATRPKDIADAIRAYADNEGNILSDTGSGNISAESAAKAVLDGYGRNVSHTSVQKAAIRCEDIQGGELSSVDQGPISKVEFNSKLDTADSLEQIADAIRAYADENGMFSSDSGAGSLMAERTAQSVLDGYGGNVSHSLVQRAVRRIEG